MFQLIDNVPSSQRTGHHPKSILPYRGCQAKDTTLSIILRRRHIWRKVKPCARTCFPSNILSHITFSSCYAAHSFSMDSQRAPYSSDLDDDTYAFMLPYLLLKPEDVPQRVYPILQYRTPLIFCCPGERKCPLMPKESISRTSPDGRPSLLACLRRTPCLPRTSSLVVSSAVQRGRCSSIPEYAVQEGA